MPTPAPPLIQIPEVATYITLALVALVVFGILLPRLTRAVERNIRIIRAIPVIVLFIGAAVVGVLARTHS